MRKEDLRLMIGVSSHDRCDKFVAQRWASLREPNCYSFNFGDSKLIGITGRQPNEIPEDEIAFHNLSNSNSVVTRSVRVRYSFLERTFHVSYLSKTNTFKCPNASNRPRGVRRKKFYYMFFKF